MLRWILALAGGLTLAGALQAQGDSAGEILRASGLKGGLIVHLGCGEGKLTAELARGGKFVVHGLDSDPGTVDRARDHIQAQGLYGRCSVDKGSLGSLAYEDNTVNLVVIDDMAGLMKKGFSLQEVARVVCPNGSVLVKGAADGFKGLKGFQVGPATGGWVKASKPWPAEMGEWTHFRNGADGNMISKDALIGPVSGVRWIAGPTWVDHYQGPEAALSANGRVFNVMFQPKGELIARDAFNGLELWRRPLALFNRSNMCRADAAGLIVAAGDRVYTCIDTKGQLVALDAATGEVVKQYETGLPTEILFYEGALILAGGGPVRSLDAATGKVRWQADKGGHDITAGDGQVFFIGNGEVIGLDAASGRSKWTQSTAGWPSKALASNLYFYQSGVVVLGEGYGGKEVCALSATDGKFLWHSPSQVGKWGSMDVFYRDGLVWVAMVGDRGWLGLDPLKGVEKKRVEYPADSRVSRRCHPFKGTDKYVWVGDMDCVDWKDGKISRINVARGGCGSGVTLANGLVYASPQGCRCKSFLRGFIAFAPKEGSAPRDGAVEVERGPAFGASISKTGASDREWPCFRHDSSRGASTSAEVPRELKGVWESDLKERVTSPVVAEGLAIVAAVDGQQVISVDAGTGKPRWRFTAGGRMDTPPTISGGLCLFGSADGWVYCVRASDGKLVWRQRVAPEERRIMVSDQLESPWPVHASVVAEGGAVCFAAGRHSELEGGITVGAAEAATGKMIWRKTLENLNRGNVNVLSDLLMGDARSVYMYSEGFDLQSGQHSPGKVPIRAGEGGKAFLMDYTYGPRSYNNRGFWSRNGVNAQLLVFDGSATYGTTPYSNAGKPDPFRGAHKPGGGYWVFASGKADWKIQVPIQVRAMMKAGNTLFVAGASDSENPGKGGKLAAFSVADGRSSGEWDLPSGPVDDGLAAADGKLYVSCQDGKVLCFGGK